MSRMENPRLLMAQQDRPRQGKSIPSASHHVWKRNAPNQHWINRRKNSIAHYIIFRKKSPCPIQPSGATQERTNIPPSTYVKSELIEIMIIFMTLIKKTREKRIFISEKSKQRTDAEVTLQHQRPQPQPLPSSFAKLMVNMYAIINRKLVVISTMICILICIPVYYVAFFHRILFFYDCEDSFHFFFSASHPGIGPTRQRRRWDTQSDAQDAAITFILKHLEFELFTNRKYSHCGRDSESELIQLEELLMQTSSNSFIRQRFSYLVNQRVIICRVWGIHGFFIGSFGLPWE